MRTGRLGQRRLRERVTRQVTAIAPGVPAAGRALLVRHAFWSFRFDDRLDDPATSGQSLARLRTGVAEVTDGHRGGAEPLLRELAGVLRELSRYDRGGELLTRFGRALREAVTADVAHVLLGRAVASGDAAPPTAAEYLAGAARSVNYHSFGYALLAVTAGGLPAASLDRLDRAMDPAARAVRLANDLRGVDRDRAAAALNILDLRRRDGRPVTARQVRAALDRYRREHDRLLAPLAAGGLVAQAAALRRCLRESLTVYAVSDFRDPPGPARLPVRPAPARPAGQPRSP